MEITFVRHGSTDWNRDRRFQGQVDIPLNAQGRAQARAIAFALRDFTFDYAVSSDLSRAYDTALAICGKRPVERDPRWREFAFGEWEGLTWEEIVSRWPDVEEHGHTTAKRYAPRGGETFEHVCERVADALRTLRESSHAGVLVVTHAGPLHAMLHALFGDRAEMQELLALRFSPASITRIEIAPDGARLVALNEVGHLD